MSFGYHRGKVPTEQMPIAQFSVQPPTTDAANRPESKAEVRAKGYTGNECSNCGSIHMQIAGHCEVCTDCGESSGCS